MNHRGPGVSTFAPASDALRTLLDELPTDHVTLRWLLDHLPRHSFGLVMLLLGIVATVPGICVPAGLLLVVAAFQMIAGHPTPSFPNWITARSLPARHLDAVTQRAVPVLRYLEKLVYPRWPVLLAMTGRLVGIAVILLSARLLLTPIPFSNVVPALAVVAISLAWLEEDGLALAIGLLMGCVVPALDLWLLRETVLGAKWINHFW